MFDPERMQTVRRLIVDYVRSPSLRHLRDPHAVDDLTKGIFDAIDRQQSVWRKWEGEREALLRAATCTWTPTEDLQAFLNDLPGPRLTHTDVAQRLRAIQEEPYTRYPDAELREDCLALYAREKADGTELPAIIGALREFVETESERRRQTALADFRRQQDEARQALEQRFLAGADCKWAKVGTTRDLYCRVNGRAYRLSPTPQKRWALFRIQAVDDSGVRIGIYGTRGDANKALAAMAYEPEPR
ncbi:hypothetical protein [Caulobacter segnis]